MGLFSIFKKNKKNNEDDAFINEIKRHSNTAVAFAREFNKQFDYSAESIESLEEILDYYSKDISVSGIHELFTEFYKNEKFVRVQPLGTYANIKNVRVSNYCDISVHLDSHTNTLIISSCIDNMVKGAAGQAIQNMNIRTGLEESTGLTALAPSF
jgi:hypothetical protein